MFGTVCTANTCSEVMSTTVVKSVKSEVVEQCALIVILVGLRAKEKKNFRYRDSNPGLERERPP